MADVTTFELPKAADGFPLRAWYGVCHLCGCVEVETWAEDESYAQCVRCKHVCSHSIHDIARDLGRLSHELCEGLRQVADGDHPAAFAEEWAREILDRPESVHWERGGGSES